MQLILLQRVVQSQNVGVERDHLLINHVVQLADAYRDDLQLSLVLTNRKHYFGQHERAFKRVSVCLLHALNSHLLDSLQDGINVLIKTRPCIFLILVKHDHVLHGSKDTIFCLQLYGV